MPTNCQQLKQEYESLQQQAGEFAGSFEAIRIADERREPIDIETVRAADLARKKLIKSRAAFEDKIIITVEAIRKLIGEKNIRGPIWAKSADNRHNTTEPNEDYLVPEVERTSPEQSV